MHNGTKSATAVSPIVTLSACAVLRFYCAVGFVHGRRGSFFQYEDDVLEAVFGGAEGLKDEAAQDSFVALVALPGYFVAVALIAKLGPRNVQVFS